MARFNVTYEIVTEESAEYGDVEDRGFIAENVTLREAIDLVCRVGGVESVECNEFPVRAPRWITVNNGMDYESGDYESRSLHIPEGVTPATRRRIARLLGAYGV